MARKKMYKNIPGFDDYLRKAYCEDRRTMSDIADEIGCTPATVLNHLRRLSIQPRDPHDHETSEKMREIWREIGKKAKGRKLSDHAKQLISEKNKGKRRRNDWEFGGYEKKRDDGYICVYVPDHPYAASDGMVMKHRLLMERKIGRYLTPDEVVHHINHKRDDNRLENLKLMTISEHMSMHMKERHQERRAIKC